jgi:hypothetical protein
VLFVAIKDGSIHALRLALRLRMTPKLAKTLITWAGLCPTLRLLQVQLASYLTTIVPRYIAK